MKLFTLLTILLVSASSSSAQNANIENMKQFVWGGESSYNEVSIGNASRLMIVKMSVPKDSLKGNVTLWTFGKDGRLSIHLYDIKLKKDSLVASYTYKFHTKKNTLTLTPKDGKSMVFDVTFTAGIIANLTLKKE